jgi:hypothetical protein
VLPDLNTGVPATPRQLARSTRPSGARRASAVALIVALMAILGAPFNAAAPPAQAANGLKAVIIVGPSGDSTSAFIASGERVAKQAEAAGMDVRRVYHPRATDTRVLQHIQGANFVLYLGHGNGWPSPYAPFQERTKNGFGLNNVDGGSASNHVYRGANWIRANVKLAPNSVVMMIGACYASGNGEPGMPIPSRDIAKQRVDNFAAGFLGAGAGVVMAFGWQQRADIPALLASSNKTMDEIFMIRSNGSPSGWVGWNDKYINSERTPGARIHLDPHSSYGYYRGLTGDLNMTANQFRSGQGGGDTGDTSAPDPAPAADTTAPAVPGGLSASTDAERRVTLNWNASTDNSGGTVRYRLIRNGVRIRSGLTTTSVVDSPTADGTYRYQVAAVDAAGNVSARSSAVEVNLAPPASTSSSSVAPSAPRNLTTQSLGYREVRLTWWRPVEDGAGGLRYKVFRDGVKIAKVTTTEFIDRPDTKGTYDYKVRAIDSAGQRSPFTATVEGTAVRGALD